MNNIKVSIIIPCRNEEKFIGRCLDSIVKQNYPKENLEVLVVDGMSEDKTKEIIKEYFLKFPYIRILENPKKITPCALNIGIKNAKGNIIIRMDGHSSYKEDYILKSVKFLNEYKADNVGGIWVIKAREKTLIGRAIAKSLSYWFGAGNAYYKIGTKGFKWVDTVPFGCYRKDVFNRVGLFNENLVRSQDMEFNLRLKKSGGKILLIPEIVGYYYARSNLKEFFYHNIEDGIWAILPLKFVKIPLRLRHYIPLIFFLTLPLSIWPYIVASLYFSMQIAIKEKDVKLFFVMPLAFFVRHIGYGFGSFVGLIKLIF